MLQKVVQPYLELFAVGCWRRKEKIIWTNHLRNEEVHSQGGREYPTNSIEKGG
jgi:hypothetical protein